MPVDVLLRDALLPDGGTADVAVLHGRVVESSDAPGEVIDLEGRLLLPAMAEPHAHLDKAFTADRFPNPTGDLNTAIEAIRVGWPEVDQPDVEERAERAARRLLAAGTTAVRSHADLNRENGMKSVLGVIAVRDRLRSLLDIQVVALADPLTGPDGAVGRRLLGEAVAAGIDAVGSCPHLEDEPLAAIDHTLAVAKESGLPADLHFDEVLDVGVQHLTALARRVERLGLGGSVAASHCVSHGLLDPAAQREVARAVADAGIAVIANPRTNLFLQARGIDQAPPRGIVGIAAMLEQEVLVAAGGDNVQDSFYSIGRSDPLETASLLVAVTHRTIDEAWSLVSDRAHAVMGLEAPSHTAGSRADFVAVRAGSLREAVAEQPPDRMVFRRGRLVARTTVTNWMMDA